MRYKLAALVVALGLAIPAVAQLNRNATASHTHDSSRAGGTTLRPVTLTASGVSTFDGKARVKGSQSFSASASGYGQIYGLSGQGLTLQGESGAARQLSTLEATGAYYGFWMTSSGLDISPNGTPTTIGGANPSAKVGFGKTTPQYVIDTSSAVGFDGIGAMKSAAGKGVMYFDSATNVFMVSENGAAARPIVDPPGNWTCTIRNGTATASVSTTMLTSTASCSGVEKALAGGCRMTGSSNQVLNISGSPTGQGWQCDAIANAATSIAVTAYANCCL